MTHQMTLAEALATAQLQMMQSDPNVILLGEDVTTSTFGASKGLREQVAEGQVLDMPISEAAFVGMALGAAANGLRPIVEIMFADFLTVCADSIVNQMAKYRFLSNDRVSLPLVIRISEGASGGGAAMHSQSLHGHFARVPGLVVATPATAGDAAGLLKTGLHGPDPMLLFEPRHAYDSRFDVDLNLPAMPLGKSRLHSNSDDQDLLIIGVGSAVRTALAVQAHLATSGVNAAVLDPVTIAPLDVTSMRTAMPNSGHVVIIEECWAGADYINSQICQAFFDLLQLSPQVFTPEFTPTPYGHHQEATWQLNPDQITTQILDHRP